jgi:hypothetical protein
MNAMINADGVPDAIQLYARASAASSAHTPASATAGVSHSERYSPAAMDTPMASGIPP